MFKIVHDHAIFEKVEPIDIAEETVVRGLSKDIVILDVEANSFNELIAGVMQVCMELELQYGGKWKCTSIRDPHEELTNEEEDLTVV